jgi:hypothetical protein
LIELGRTPIKMDNLRHYLKIYPNRDDAFVLLDGFTSGFRVNLKDVYCTVANSGSK